MYQRFSKYERATEDCIRYYNEYPHAIAYYCAKVLDIYLSSVEMPMYSIDEKGNMDATMFCALMLKSSVKYVGELTFLQKRELLEHKVFFPEREKQLLKEIKDNKICIHFGINILDNEERKKYYKEFLSEHNIYNHKLTSSKEFCLKNLAALDSFVKDELIFQDLLYVFEESDVLDFLCSKHKICSETFKIEELPHKEKKYLIDNYEVLSEFIKTKIHDKYDKLSKEFPLGIEYLKQEIDGIKLNYLDLDSPIPVIQENSSEWWRKKFFKAKTYGCTQYELDIWYKYRGKNSIRYKLSKLQKEAENCESIRVWNKKQFLFSTECQRQTKLFLSGWLSKSDRLKNRSHPNGENIVQDNYYFRRLIYKLFCLDNSFDISPYPFVAGVGELACTFIGTHPIPNSELTNLGNFLIELNKHYNPISVVFYLDSVNKDRREHILNSYFTVFIRQLLDNGITVCNNLEGLQISKNQTVVIIDLVSTIVETNEFLLEFIKKYKDKSPLLSYISFYHEETTQNIIKIAQLKEDKKNEAIRIKKEKEAELLQEKQSLESCVSSWYDIGYPAMKCFSMYNYYPTTCEFEATNEEWNIRKLIWNFKANKGGALSNARAMSKIVPNVLQCLSYFFGGNLSKLTFVCIPASTRHITKLRYEKFSQEICKFTGMENGYSHITIEADGEAKHTGGKTKAQYKLDANFFKNKYILLFDDVITKGNSMCEFKSELEKLGSIVIGGFSIGVTKHERQSDNPIDKLDLPELNVEIPNYFLEILSPDELPF